MNLEDFPIIDMHVHVFPEKIALRAAENIRDYYSLPMKGDGTFAKYLKLAENLNLKKIIISSAATKPQSVCVANDFIFKCLERDPRLMGMGSTHAAFDDQEREFERIVEMGLCGIKLHCDFQGFAIDDERMDKAYRLAENYRLPVLFHMGDESSDLTTPMRLRRVMEKFPDLIIIAAHMGGYLQKEWSERYLVGQNVYFDVSEWENLMSAEELCDMIERHGREKVLFGCDYPLISPFDAALSFANCGLGSETLHMIFHKNAEKLFKINS